MRSPQAAGHPQDALKLGFCGVAAGTAAASETRPAAGPSTGPGLLAAAAALIGVRPLQREAT